MDCKRLSEVLDDYIDGILSPEEMHAVEIHADSCESCAEELKAAKLLKDMLKGMQEETVAVPLEAQAAWRNAIRTEAKHRKMRAWVRYGGALAAALVLVIGSTFLFHQENSNDVSSQVSLRSMPSAEGELIARDGDEELQATVSLEQKSYSAYRKIETENVEDSVAAVESLSQEYSGTCTCSSDNLYRIELPYENMQDFLNAIKGLGTELDSETVEDTTTTAVIFLQFIAK